MKKILLTMLGAVLIAAPAFAQEPVVVAAEKVDVNKLKTAIAKSDAEIANAKKATKAATWVKRGKTFVEVDGKPVSGIYMSMPEDVLKMTYGDATPAVESISGKDYTVYTYEPLKAYLLNGVVDFFVPLIVADPAALDKAYEAFVKAYEMDTKTAKAVREGLNLVKSRSIEEASGQYSLGNYKDAATNFRRAYNASIHPTAGPIDTLSLYYAGMSSAHALEHEAAIVDLRKAFEMGYEVEGDIYRMLFIELYNLERREEAFNILQAGLARFPANEDLIDMMMRYYADNDGDPSSMIPLVEEAIAKNPENPMLFQGLARIYDKLGDRDKAIETMRKAVALDPGDFHSNYLEGLFIVYKGDAMDDELEKQTFTSMAQSQQARAKVNEVFMQAIAPLEKAYEINPQEIATVQLLKNLSFRLRDLEGMQAKYDKYNELWISMEGPTPVE